MQIKLHPDLGQIDPQLPRRDLLKCVRLVKNQKVPRKKKALTRLRELRLAVQEGEEERVIHDEHIGLRDLLLHFLIKAFSRRTTASRRADMRLAANLRPDPTRRGKIEIAQRPVLRFPSPFPNRFQFLQLRRSEHLPAT